ncbi:unnamed protein product [Brassica napus]|uniref:(rape) hypothetical protein n=1 Tax=Brassica napus TaxID=3708 RepID=A0A816J2J1_BRANA|nr:unnamed protein product [Brassica napus]
MVVTKIEAIDLDKPWYYTACNFCKRKMARQGDGFEGNMQHLQHNPIYNCKTCNKDFEHAIHCVFFSYYLVVRVFDDSKGEVKFLLFNNIVERLIKRPAFELVQEAGQENPHFLPQSLTDLIGRKLLFKITIAITMIVKPTKTSVVPPLGISLCSKEDTIGYQETISRSTLRKRKTIGSPPSVNSKTRHKEARQGPNMTRHSIPTGPAVSVEDAPREATQSPFQQTKTNEFIPPPRFIVEDHPEVYNNQYAMESESENENDNEDEENQTYTTYPAGETLINTSPQHIP